LPLRALDTVAVETPASLATSTIPATSPLSVKVWKSLCNLVPYM